MEGGKACPSGCTDTFPKECFWELLIGNDAYPKAPLSDCFNDVDLIRHYLMQYLNVPLDHIRALRDASRETLIKMKLEGSNQTAIS